MATLKPYQLTNGLAPRQPDCHKGDFGRVMIAAGSPGLTGAAYLCAQAALKTGSGLVTLVVPRCLEKILETKTTEVMTRGVPCTLRQELSEFSFEDLWQSLPNFDAFAFGPGVGRGSSTQKLLWKLLADIAGTLVIDADGLHLLAGGLAHLATRQAPTILTPHPGEMAALTGRTVPAIQSARESCAAEFAEKHNVIVVLKGYRTVVTDGHSLYINETGHPTLASGGTGDVLTGMIVALLGQGKPAFDAAALGAYSHGLAAELAVKERGALITAAELLHYIPPALARTFQLRRPK